MRRSAKILALTAAVAVVAAATAACGTQKISVARSQSSLYHGAYLFNQRCAGCHTLSYAATWGSAPNVRTAMAISGPNFNTRCERPIARILYAIENGGFSGAYMPQNIVVGQDAVEVAKFVATYAGRQAPIQIGVVPCRYKPLGTLPAGSGTTQVASVSSTSSNSSTTSTTSAAPASNGGTGAKGGKGGKGATGANGAKAAKGKRARKK